MGWLRKTTRAFVLVVLAGCDKPSADPPSTAAPPADAPSIAAPTSPADATVAIELHEVQIVERSLFDGHKLPPEVELVPYYLERKSAGVKPRIERVLGETLATTVARVRPWFDTIPVGPDGRWVAWRVPAADADGEADVVVELVRGRGIEITRGDIAKVEMVPGFGNVDVELTVAGHERLRAQIDTSKAHDFSVVVAGRVVGDSFMPKGAVFSGIDLVHLGSDRVATAIRNAIVGDPAAIEVVANDRAEDGGTLEQHEIARGVRAAPPVPSAEGRQSVALDGLRAREVGASVAVPEELVVRKQGLDRVEWARGTRWPDVLYLSLSSGCNGDCVPGLLATQIDDACAKLSRPSSDVKEATVILDERTPAHRRCGVTRKRSASSGGIEDVMLHCYVRGAGDDVFIRLEVHAPAKDRDDALAVFGPACDSLREDPTAVRRDE